MRAMALAAEISGTVFGSLLVFLGGGIWLDRRLDTSPLFLLLGLLLAFIAIGYTLYELATVGTRRRGRAGGTAAAGRGASPEPPGIDDRRAR